MLELRKKSFFSNDYIARDHGYVVAELDRATWRQRAEITIEGRKLRMEKHGTFKDTFVLFEGDNALVEVAQPKALRSRLEFRWEGRDYAIRERKWYRSEAVVESGAAEIGRVRFQGFFASAILVDLPDTMPVALRVFIGWISIVRHDERAAAAAAAGAG